MNCRRCRKSLIDFVDNRLDEPLASRVSEHLASCEECSAAREKLAFSSLALASLETVEMPEAASRRVLENLTSAAVGRPGAARASTGTRLRTVFTPRTLAAAGTAVAVIFALAIFAVVFRGGLGEREAGSPESTSPGGLTEFSDTAPSDLAEEAQKLAVTPMATILPVAKASQNNYNGDTLRDTFQNMDMCKQIASQYSMTHAATLGTNYRRKLADLMVEQGQDGAVLEAMIVYLTASEPVLLPFYAESAQFQNEGVYVIGMAGPRRTGTGSKLSRTEVWVLNPSEFAASPDSSIVYFLEIKLGD